MTTSLMQQVDIQTSKMKSVLSQLLGRNVISMNRIEGGKNSRVYGLTCSNFSQYVAKLYFHRKLSQKNRLGAEFSSLQFLWQNGVRCIPQPIAVDNNQGYAVFEYIDGKKISSQEVTSSDIDYTVQFLARLKKLKSRKGSRFLPPASEACFSIKAIVNNIEQRLSRLLVLQDSESQYRALREFLINDFMPSFDEITKWCKSSLNKSEICFASDLRYEERTLSPSDFGFHNALRCSDGQLVFLDFEHFGWDDPAKMVSDFLLHPAMEVPESLKWRFVASILSHSEDNKYLARRVKIVYPLFGLKWCLIFLNEFLPEDLLRRGFASEIAINKRNLQVQQLKKAGYMLQKMRRDYESFPYHD